MVYICHLRTAGVALMGGKRRKKRETVSISPWWGLLVVAIAVVMWAAVDDFLKLNPEKPIPAATKTP